MDLGFETIGNATVICHDRGPVLATDPWLGGSAYFGSWGLSHEFPAEQQAHVRACKYLWISHGHPDHLHLESLATLRDKEILLPDHYGGPHGGRVARELTAQGFRVRVLKDGAWTQLSDHLRVISIGDVNQDAVLLIDLGGHLVVDANDASDHGGGEFLRELARGYASSYLTCLTGWGDADMIHFFDEQGRQLPPPATAKESFGQGIAGLLGYYGIKRFVPGSSMHRYQRADSVWANACTTPLGEHARGFPQGTLGELELLPAFVEVDLGRGTHREIQPAENPPRALPPEDFGDRWSDPLEPADVEKLRAYLAPIEHLRSFLGYVRFRVGGREHVIDVAREHAARGITFEVPRQSLMTAVEHRVFDDLLIGNFMKTTLHGPWPRQGTQALYPDFSPFVGKYADNGDARSAAELRAYFAEYRRRGFFGPGPTPASHETWATAARYV